MSAASQEAAAPSEEPDEVTEDEIRSRAKDIIRRNGWLEQKAPPQLHSIIELMVSLGIDVLKNRPASCGYPGCGCDFDAVCNAALASPAVAPVAVSVKDLPLWQVGSWGDGSTPAGQANIFCEAYEVTIATGIDWVKADDIVTCHNEALSSIIPATKGGEDELGMVYAPHVTSALAAAHEAVTSAEHEAEQLRAALRKIADFSPGSRIQPVLIARAALSAQDTDGVAKP